MGWPHTGCSAREGGEGCARCRRLLALSHVFQMQGVCEHEAAKVWAPGPSTRLSLHVRGWWECGYNEKAACLRLLGRTGPFLAPLQEQLFQGTFWVPRPLHIPRNMWKVELVLFVIEDKVGRPRPFHLCQPQELRRYLEQMMAALQTQRPVPERSCNRTASLQIALGSSGEQALAPPSRSSSWQVSLMHSLGDL